MLELSRQLKLEIKTARSTFYTETLANFLKTEPQRFWCYLAEPKYHTKTVEIAGVVVEDEFRIANFFNEYFQSVFTRITPVSMPETTFNSLMPDISITEEGVLNLLLQVNAKKVIRSRQHLKYIFNTICAANNPFSSHYICRVPKSRRASC